MLNGRDWEFNPAAVSRQPFLIERIAE